MLLECGCRIDGGDLGAVVAWVVRGRGEDSSDCHLHAAAVIPSRAMILS